MLMIIGRDRESKELARSVQIKCPHCVNLTPFILYESKDCVKLFFCKIFSYNTTYFLSCSICASGWDLDEKDVDEFYRINMEIV